MLSFWVRREGQEIWEPVPAEGTVLEEDTYTIVARSPQPHFTITVEVRQYPLAPGESLPTSPASKEDLNTTPAQTQSRSVRTNDEGIGIILPASHLTPGFWELHCRDADLIAELFGEAEAENCLRFQVMPSGLGSSLPMGRPLEMALPPLAEPEPVPPANPQDALPERVPFSPESTPEPTPEWAAELFSLMHTELEGSPDEVLVLTGRIGCSGELRVQVWQQGKDLPIFEGQRLIQFPPEARTAVFSIPITLPNHTWTRPLNGELVLTPTSTGWRDPNSPSQPLTIAFSIRCRGESDSLNSPPAEEASAPSPGIPLTRLREGAAQAASSRRSSTTTLLSPERTLQKLLRIWQQSTPMREGDPTPPVLQVAEPIATEPETTTPAQPQVVATATSPATEPQALQLPSADLSPQLTPEPELSRIPVAELELPAPTPELPSSEGVFPPDVVAAPIGESLLPPHPPGLCPTPQLLVPEQLRAGDNFDVVLRLPALAEPPPSGFTHQAPFWIKFWVKHGRTRSLVDGPRWLLDFSCDEQGQWQALTRMTIPPGVPELIFEAWAVSPDRQQQSDRVTERRLIQP
ncbi:hypothetical protein L1047_04790 [Synechococcus sp. Nb3U1]|uniref:hypothetical protein n=1 Tax=Synechococcus sp. Nb3U1 TaxID=1914529 RepID=UPI001F34D147|nr:hypothetical protein [Synechococcus sp. Nb3U1]MCF2970511.1 hypothetical protein [Synechococcus sp. Nb3U1]